MIECIVSGGQSGVDQAAWRAAKLCGVATGGWMPSGWLTEDGPRPEFAELYGATEHESAQYPPRTRANVELADGTLIFALAKLSAGTNLTLTHCLARAKPHRVLSVGRDHARDWGLTDLVRDEPTSVGEWIRANGIRVLNVAGPRESSAPGLGRYVELYLTLLFGELGVDARGGPPR